MNDTQDLLQIKIEKAKAELPEESRQAIDAVNWKAAIIGLRTKKGYTFEQLGDLETETELLLCGLTDRDAYPKELSKRLAISQTETDSLIKEMNDLVFEKIRQELVKITERQNSNEALAAVPQAVQKQELQPARKLDAMELSAPASSMLAQKFTGPVKIPIKKTEHTLSNVSKPAPAAYSKNADPYRLSPDE